MRISDWSSDVCSSDLVLADIIKHETGLITVTVMGVVMANRPMYSSTALRRFKEDLAVLLISGVFIILSATLDYEVIQHFRLRYVLFLVLLLFVIRPVTRSEEHTSELQSLMRSSYAVFC